MEEPLTFNAWILPNSGTTKVSASLCAPAWCARPITSQGSGGSVPSASLNDGEPLAVSTTDGPVTMSFTMAVPFLKMDVRQDQGDGAAASAASLVDEDKSYVEFTRALFAHELAKKGEAEKKRKDAQAAEAAKKRRRLELDAEDEDEKLAG
eukprot:2530367-Pyramimonas_sp.AAC.1